MPGVERRVHGYLGRRQRLTTTRRRERCNPPPDDQPPAGVGDAWQMCTRDTTLHPAQAATC